MNNKIKTILFTLIILMTGAKAYAYDILAANSDGVTIYYKYINNDTELEVTYYVSKYQLSEGSYRGDIVIPEKVVFLNRNLKVTSIGKEAFRFCEGLISITIPNSVTSIGEHAFRGCSNLSSITIPNSVTSIGEYAFYNCTALSSITIPNNVTIIEPYTFVACFHLTSITISNSVTNIGEWAFRGCSGLTSITIPSSVASIGNSAFRNCNLTAVISQIEQPFEILGISSSTPTFSTGIFNNATLYVPKGTIEKYKATEGWKDFQHIEEGIPSNVVNVRANTVLIQSNGNILNVQGAEEGTDIQVYDMAGRSVGSARAAAGTTAISTTLSSGAVGIVKIGDKAVKVVVR